MSSQHRHTEIDHPTRQPRSIDWTTRQKRVGVLALRRYIEYTKSHQAEPTVASAAITRYLFSSEALSPCSRRRCLVASVVVYGGATTGTCCICERDQTDKQFLRQRLNPLLTAKTLAAKSFGSEANELSSSVSQYSRVEFYLYGLSQAIFRLENGSPMATNVVFLLVLLFLVVVSHKAVSFQRRSSSDFTYT